MHRPTIYRVCIILMFYLMYKMSSEDVNECVNIIKWEVNNFLLCLMARQIILWDAYFYNVYFIPLQYAS